MAITSQFTNDQLLLLNLSCTLEFESNTNIIATWSCAFKTRKQVTTNNKIKNKNNSLYYYFVEKNIFKKGDLAATCFLLCSSTANRARASVWTLF